MKVEWIGSSVSYIILFRLAEEEQLYVDRHIGILFILNPDLTQSLKTPYFP